jgi:hypothetical protein
MNPSETSKISQTGRLLTWNKSTQADFNRGGKSLKMILSPFGDQWGKTSVAAFRERRTRPQLV